MSKKAKDCEVCKHWSWLDYDDIEDYNHSEQRNEGCAKKHKPRFYNPPKDDPYHGDWGWRRRCGDFII